MKKFIFLFCLGFCFFVGLKSQNFNIEYSDVLNDNPYKIKVDFTGNKIIKKEDIKVQYAEKDLDFEFQSHDVNASKGRVFCILVETTGFTHAGPIKNFKNAIPQLLDLLNPEDKVALCSFSEATPDKGTSLKILSKEFVEDKTIIKNLTNKLVTKIDTNAQADIYKSIYEALDWMNEQKDLPEQKYLIVFTAGINQSLSTIRREDCENKSTSLNIPIYSVVHKTWTAYSGDNFKLLSDNTKGRFKFVDKPQTITEFLSAALNLEVEKSVLSYKYQIIFQPEKVQSGMNTFDLIIQDEIVKGEFIIEKKMDTQFETILFIAAGIGVLLIGIGFFMKSKKEEVNQPAKPLSTPISYSNIPQTPPKSEIKQPNLANTIVNTPPIAEVQKTAIASSNIPTLKIVSVNGTQIHRIEKLPLTIGRESYNDVVIQDNSVSKKHAELYFDNGFFYLLDLDSTNGLVVNGQKIAKVQLKENEKVYLGNATLELYLA